MNLAYWGVDEITMNNPRVLNYLYTYGLASGRLFYMLSVVFSCAAISFAHADIQLEEITRTSGISHIGHSWSAAWGDYNGDTLPDLWTTNHGAVPTLYLNLGDGKFVKSTPASATSILADTHGAAWADYDNDGDQDLIELVGGAGANHLFINTQLSNGERTFVESANLVGLDYPPGRGRTPLWFDWNNDGAIDILLTNGQSASAPTALFEQTMTGFDNVTGLAGLSAEEDTDFAILYPLSENGNLNLILHGGPFPQRIYDISTTPFLDLTATQLIPDVSSVADAAVGDYDGDMLPDLFLARAQGEPDLLQPSDSRVESLVIVNGNTRGIKFSSSGSVTFDLWPIPGAWTLSQIFIGNSRLEPASSRFTLDPNDPSVHMLPANLPNNEEGIFIFYDPTENSWYLSAYAPSRKLFTALVDGSQPLTGVTPIGFQPRSLLHQSQLFHNTGQGFIDQTSTALVSMLASCWSVVSGDFDNDMDLDIYEVCNRGVGNRSNVLYENNGNGIFTPVPNSGGASGSLFGIGDSATVVDYDMDGFLDLFVTNGFGSRPAGLHDGSDQLFHNLGNGNHWLQIDLEGVISNRDGIGSKVLISTGNRVQQRIQNGGMHARNQNHPRLHFGLGSNPRVDNITVSWPSGIQQELNNIAADQILHLIEPSFPSQFGKPYFRPGIDSGVYLWADAAGGPYHLRINGDGEEDSSYVVKLVSTTPIVNVSRSSLASNNGLQVSSTGFEINTSVLNNEDGVEFSTTADGTFMLSVVKDGKSNSRQVHVGTMGFPVSPSGWIISSNELPLRPNFLAGTDLGLYIGAGSKPDILEARWSADKAERSVEVELITSSPFDSIEYHNLNQSMAPQTTSSSISLQGQLTSSWAGVDVDLPNDANIGIAYRQEGTFAPRHVNPSIGQLGSPNAYIFTITDFNKPPSLDAPIEPQSATQGAQFGPLDLSGHFSDQDGDELTFSISGLPTGSGLSISTTGIISGTPTQADSEASPISVTVTAEDPSMAAVSTTANLIVMAIDSNGDGISDAQAIALRLNPTDADGDTDDDGTSDLIEVGNPDNPLDSDSDGLIDALEAGPTALDASVANGLTTIEGVSITIINAGSTLSDVSITPVTGGPAGVLSQFGVISYKTTSPIGGSATVRLVFSDPLPPNLDVYKVDNAGVFKKLPTSMWKRIDARIIDITLVDGGILTDLDLTINGVIVDPIALADGSTTTTSPDIEGNGGGGCSLQSTSSFDPQLIFIVAASLFHLYRRRTYLSDIGTNANTAISRSSGSKVTQMDNSIYSLRLFPGLLITFSIYQLHHKTID